MTKVISFANQKGGVAKTTTTFELGELLAKYFDKKVLMIDLDPQASLTIIKYDVAKVSENKEKTVDRIMLEKCGFEDVIVNLKHNLFLAPATLKLSDSELNITNAMSREFILKDALDKVKDKFDYVLIDCPPSRGILTVNALVASDNVIIPVQAEYQALLGVQLLKNTIKQVKHKINRDLTVSGFVITMTTHTNHSNEIIDSIYNDEFDVMGSIPRSIDVADAAVANVSTYEYRKDNNAGKAYYDLAKKIVGGK